MSLDTVTVNGVPAPEGTALVGLATQLGGAPAPQLRLTALLYPFIAMSVPLKTAEVFTEDVSEGFAIARL